MPSSQEVEGILGKLGRGEVIDISERAITTRGLVESDRYFIQHSLGYQTHDVDRPHNFGHHGRAEIGWDDDSS